MLHIYSIGTTLIGITFFLIAPLNAQLHVVGWQTFENSSSGNNNSGIQDNTPDTNTTYDPTPTGSNSNSLYLTGAIGSDASYWGRTGLGQATNNDFLNNGTFGNDLLITDYSLADGSPGSRIGPYGNPAPNGEQNDGTSSWKFSKQSSTANLNGDFCITNHSDYHFRLEHIHFDARGLPNESTSPDTLTIRYLASPGELINASTNSEVTDQRIIYQDTWTAKGFKDVSHSLAAEIGSAVRVPPGQKASFRLEWSNAQGNGHAQIDNLAFSGTFLDESNSYSVIDPTTVNQPANNGNINIIVIIPDDQRWDSTSYMQSRMGAEGRIARFPWLNTPPATPNIDSLYTEGIHFQNAFSVYSLCSPARATMLTGQHAHIHGITDNDTALPSDTTTYASLLRDAGYATGYFGKWHMGTQDNRPGFTEAVTYAGQGNYYVNDWIDQNGAALFSTNYNNNPNEWIDDVSTDKAAEFITAKNNANTPFLCVLGFKTPHSPRNMPPSRTANLYSNDAPASVPNLSHRTAYAPNASQGNDLADLRGYMRNITAIDDNVGEILDLLDTLNIADNTAVIYISDQGYFRGEHGLGDKRAAYEESILIPFMIRYPAAQSAASAVNKIALNLDLAPTILDIAGLEIPESMQGASLLPFITGQIPTTWRDSFLFSYNHDPEFPTATIRPYIAIRREDGSKLVNYAKNSAWNELFQTDVAYDPYEIDNLYFLPQHESTRDDLEDLLRSKATEQGFLKIKQNGVSAGGGALTLQAGNSSHFIMEASQDLSTWTEMGRIEGNGSDSTLSLIHLDSTSSLSISGETADYTLTEGSPVGVNQGYATLVSGSQNPGGGREAVLIFALPELPSNLELARAELEITAKRQFAMWDSELWTLGIHDTTSPILEFSESPSGNPNVIKIQDAFLTDLVGTNVERISSSPISRLTDYLQSFYERNPGYTGGKYIFLRINPSWDIGVNLQKYTISSASNSDTNQRPVLNLHYRNPSSNPHKYFHRIRYGNE